MAGDMVQLLSRSFSSYVSSTDTTSWESSRQTANCLEVLRTAGMSGRVGLQAIKDFRPIIAWEYMMPDQFCKWYRFVFHLCKEPQRKHVQVNVAIEAWSLVMAGRFRLLDKWLDFVQQRKSSMRVINEDQWRQLLDFSQSVYEDLSNFDPKGAWACCLDEFVDHLRSTRSCLWDKATDNVLGFNGMECMTPVSPHSGSKRRPPDPVPIDPVTDQLNNIHLPHSPDNPNTQSKLGNPPQPAKATPKRLCIQQLPEHKQQQQQQQQDVLSAASSGQLGAVNQLLASCSLQQALQASTHSGSPYPPCNNSVPLQSGEPSSSPCLPSCTTSPSHRSPLRQQQQQQQQQHKLHKQMQHQELAQPLPSAALVYEQHREPIEHVSSFQTSANSLGSGMALDLPLLHIPQRRYVKPRRTGVAELVHQSVSDVFGFTQGS